MSDCRRFTMKIEVQPDGCWLWQASMSPTGYGRFYLDGRMTTAHRAAYLMFVGPLRAGLEIDHLCRVRACVNPLHLEAVTHRENLARSVNFAARNAAKDSCPFGHAYDGTNTRVRPNGSRECRECRRRRNREAARVRRAKARAAA